jgi:hypothetical protein
MTKLINISDIVAFKPLSLNINVAKFLDPYIIEAQEFDLKPVLGDPLYLDLLNNIGDYVNLFEPFEYVWQGYNYKHEGIKASLIYFTYARYLANANQHSTSSGMVTKLNEFSTPIDDRTTSRLIKQAQSGAIAYQEQYLTYLCRFSTEYPLYNVGCRSNYRKSSIRINRAGI